MTIKPATSADWKDIQTLLTRLNLPEDGAKEHLQHYHLMQDAQGTKAVAGLEVYPPVALLRSVAVAPEHQGQGLGEQLVTHLIEQARAQGISDLYLLTTTAAQYFPRFGFQEIQRTEVPDVLQTSREFQGACPDSATVMHLSLTPHPADLLRQVTRLHHQLQQLTPSCLENQTLTRCHILSELGKAGQLTVADLVVRLRLDKAWMSRNVESLLQDGLVTKTRHDTDGRASWIRLTPAGEQHLQQLNGQLNAQTRRILTHIPPEEQTQVLHALTLLHQALQTEFALASTPQKEETA